MSIGSLNSMRQPKGQTRKHVFGDDYAILTVVETGNNFHGTLSCTRSDISESLSEVSGTLDECCAEMDRRFEELVPDHECGSQCLANWQPLTAMFKSPSGPPV